MGCSDKYIKLGNQGFHETTRQTILSSNDWNSVEEIKEDQNEDQVTNSKGNNDDFSGFSGYSMRTSKQQKNNDNGEESPAFKTGYKMVMK